MARTVPLTPAAALASVSGADKRREVPGIGVHGHDKHDQQSGTGMAGKDCVGTPTGHSGLWDLIAVVCVAHGMYILICWQIRQALPRHPITHCCPFCTRLVDSQGLLMRATSPSTRHRVSGSQRSSSRALLRARITQVTPSASQAADHQYRYPHPSYSLRMGNNQLHGASGD